MESVPANGAQDDDSSKDLVDVFMTGGPPWGFNISGGSEFGTDLFIRKVAEDGIAMKVGRLAEGDTLVYINGVNCTSRAKAIDTVRMGKNELRLKIRRNNSADAGAKPLQPKTGPKRSNSFYGSVVENMLENVSNDISSTHYSRRRNTFEKEMANARKKRSDVFNEEVVTENVNEILGEKKDESKSVEWTSTANSELKALSPSDEKSRLGQAQASPRNFQRVKIKSVNVTAMVPSVKSDISEQLKSKTCELNKNDTSQISPTSDEADNPTLSKHQFLRDDDKTRQTKSMDEGIPIAHQSWKDLPRKTIPPPVASKPTKARHENSETGSESPAMNVSKARQMFEGLSKSQENLDAVGIKNESKNSPSGKRKEMAPMKTIQLEDKQAVAAPQSVEELRRPVHSHTKSLPLENFEGPRKDFRRPGSAPNRRSNRQIRPKSAHFPSDENTDSQSLPLGYAAVPSATRLNHGRKSIASCAPSASLYKKESTFRHSSEDLRPSVDASARFEKKSSTLPANQMREAAKRFHKELMKKDPKFRYSLNAAEPPSRPAHLGSFTGGSSGSSLGSSQDQLNNFEPTRRSSGGSVFTRACSTSSLDSSPGHHDALGSPSEEDNTILSRLLREQRQNSNGNLKIIEEEARSPRSKISPRGGSLTSSETVESNDESGKRTISIQTDFIPEASKKRELFNNRPSLSDTSKSFSATISTRSSIETCIDDVDPSFIDNTESPNKNDSNLAEDMQRAQAVVSEQPVSHEKEASTDSVDELSEINKNREETEMEKMENLPLMTDIDALPPPPDELLIASPPQKEKHQRVINRKKRDQHSSLGASRNSSCVSTDSNISTSTMDSGIGVRACSMSDSSPRHSPTRVTSEFDDYYNHVVDEGFKGSREELDDADECPAYGSGPITPPDELERRYDTKESYVDADAERSSTPRLDTPGSSQSGSRPGSVVMSPKIEELDQEKTTLIDSMRRKIEELKSQEREIADEIKLNEDLGKRVRGLVEIKATQTEFSKYELFIGELNKIVALLLSLTQRLHRYEQMLQDLDMSDEEDKQKRDSLISKIDRLREQHEEACHLREVNDKRGENVANFLDRYFNEEEFADFQYYVDMKSQLALMKSEIKEKVKLGEERYQALDSTGIF